MSAIGLEFSTTFVVIFFTLDSWDLPPVLTKLYLYYFLPLATDCPTVHLLAIETRLKFSLFLLLILLVFFSVSYRQPELFIDLLYYSNRLRVKWQSFKFEVVLNGSTTFNPFDFMLYACCDDPDFLFFGFDDSLPFVCSYLKIKS